MFNFSNGTPEEQTFLRRLKSSVITSLLWNAFESILYQIIYLSHHAALFYTIDRTLYGTYGALFAFIYLIIMFANMSFEIGVIPFFSIFSETKQNFRHLVTHYLLPQAFLLASIAYALGLFLYNFSYGPRFIIPLLHGWGILCLVIFVTTEGMKKNIRALLQLAFQNKKTAWIEIANIFCYVSTVWIAHQSGVPFSLQLLVVPFIGVSFITVMVLSLFLYGYYKKLPDGKNTVPHSIKKRIITNRFFLFINQMGNVLFSSNFLLPLFACQTGLQQAGMMTFVNSITFSFTIFIQRVFGPSGAALFARTKLLSLESKRSAFSFLYRKCWYLVISLLTLFIVNGKQLLSLKLGEQPLSLWVVIYIFSLSHVLETLFLLYDKLFAAEELAHYTALVNSISFLLCVSIAFVSSSLMVTLLCCCIVRLITFFCLTLIAHITCGISLPYKLPLKKLLVPFAVSLIIAVLIKMH